MAGIPGGATMLRLLGLPVPANAPPEVAAENVMPGLPQQQAEAVRVLQEGTYKPVGQILAAGLGGVVTQGVGQFVGSVVGAVKGAKMDLTSFLSSTQTDAMGMFAPILQQPQPGPQLPQGLGQLGKDVSSILRDFGIGVPFALQEQAPTVPGVGVPSSTAVSGNLPSCFVHTSGPMKGQPVKSRRRQSVHIVTDPATGTRHVMLYCKKRSMNPLNPKALGRAATRIGRFQAISAHINKRIDKALRRSGARASRGFGGRRRVYSNQHQCCR